MIQAHLIQPPDAGAERKNDKAINPKNIRGLHGKVAREGAKKKAQGKEKSRFKKNKAKDTRDCISYRENKTDNEKDHSINSK